MLQALAGEAGYLAELFGSSEAYPETNFDVQSPNSVHQAWSLS